jgi:hypothetical protein
MINGQFELLMTTWLPNAPVKDVGSFSSLEQLNTFYPLQGNSIIY